MDLDALKEQWQQRGAPGPYWTRGEDMSELRQKLANIRRAAGRRDLREAIAAIAVAGIFTWVGLTAAQPLARAGAWIVVASAFFIIVWSRVAGGRNREPESDLPVVEFFRRELHYLDRQIHLLRSVFWWYSAPNLLGIELFFLASTRSGGIRVALMALPIVIAAGVYRLNRVAADRELQPLRDEVARLLGDLESNGAPIAAPGSP